MIIHSTGEAIPLTEGTDIAIFATGTMVHKAMEAYQILKNEEIRCTGNQYYTIKPLDKNTINTAARETGVVVSVEEHSILGGLGGSIAEVL